MSELQGIYLNTNKPLRNKFGVREKTLLSIALFVFLLIIVNSMIESRLNVILQKTILLF